MYKFVVGMLMTRLLETLEKGLTTARQEMVAFGQALLGAAEKDVPTVAYELRWNAESAVRSEARFCNLRFLREAVLGFYEKKATAFDTPADVRTFFGEMRQGLEDVL